MGLGSTFIPREIQERFEVLRPIAPTKRWETYLAEDRRDGALCVLRIDRTRPETPEEREHLKESLLRLRRVQHPALAPLRRFGLPPRGGYYTVHEFVSGSTLEDLRGEMDWATVVNAMVRILPGLHLLHLSGIVHQRLSGEKIALRRTEHGLEHMVLDAGPAERPDGRRWAPWSIRAPEVAREERFDGRADLYSLAVMVHDLMTGSPPSTDAAAERAAKLGEYRDVPPMRAFREDCPPILEEILMRMGSHDPKDRPRTAIHLAQELRRTGLVEGPPPKVTTREMLRATRWRLVETRVGEVLEAIPEDQAIGQMTCDPGLETLASEVEARLAFRRGRNMIRVGGDPLAGPGPVTQGLHLVDSRETEGRVRDDGAGGYRLPVRGAVSAGDVADWLSGLVSGILDEHRVPLTSKWLCWVAGGVETEVCRRLPLTLSNTSQNVVVDWRRLQRNLAESLRTGTAERPDTEFPARSPALNAALVGRAALPTAAARILEQDVATDPDGARTRTNPAFRLFRAAIHWTNAGLYGKAARCLMQASVLLKARRVEFARTLSHRADALSLTVDGKSGIELGPQSDGNASHWAELARQEWLFQQGDLDQSIEVGRAALERQSILFGPHTHEQRLRWLTISRQQSRSLFRARHFDRLRDLTKRAASVREDGRLSLGHELEMQSEAFCLVVEEDFPGAQRVCESALHRNTERGKTFSAGIAMELLSRIHHDSGDFETAVRWGERALMTLEDGGSLYTRPRRLAGYGALLFGIGDYPGAAKVSIASLRSPPPAVRSKVDYGQVVTIGLSLLSLGRIRSGVKWLRKTIAKPSVPRASVRCALLGLVQAHIALHGASGLAPLVTRTMRSGIGLHGVESADLIGEMLLRDGTIQEVASQLHGDVADAFEAILGYFGSSSSGVRGDSFLNGVNSAADTGTGQLLSSLSLRAGRYFRDLVAIGEPTSKYSWQGIESFVRRLLSEGNVLHSARLSGIAACRCLETGNVDGAARLHSIWARARALLLKGTHESDRESLEALCLDRDVLAVRGRIAESREVCFRLEEAETDFASSAKRSDGPSGLPARLDTRIRGLIDEIIGLGDYPARIRVASRAGDSSEVAELGGTQGRKAALRREEFDRIASLLGESGCLHLERGESSLFVVVRPESDDTFVYAWFMGDCGFGPDARMYSVQMLKLLGDAISRQIAHAESTERRHRPRKTNRHSTAFPSVAELDLGEGHSLLFSTKRMSAAVRSIERLARRHHSVMLIGESGTGKELLARYYHQASGRSRSQFVAVDCPGLCSGVAESELFGHVTGAFTGADRARIGLLEAACGGTLFLDEIGDLPAGMQAKLLRVLSANEVRPIGGTSTRSVQFSVVCATNIDLRNAVSRGEFRRDLFHRLGIIVRVPPLRERRGDVLPLWDRFLGAQCDSHELPSYSESVVDLLMSNDWPGNVRQLENVACAAYALSDDDGISGHLIESLLAESQGFQDEDASGSDAWSVGDRKWKALDLVRRHGRVNRSAYADVAGISERSALRDLNDLVGRGILRRIGKGRGTRYVQAEVKHET